MIKILSGSLVIVKVKPWEGPDPSAGQAPEVTNQLDELPAILLPTVVKVLLALLPSVVMAPMQTTIIRASMTAYSTAVGPSSRFKNSTANCASFRICFLLCETSRTKNLSNTSSLLTSYSC